MAWQKETLLKYKKELVQSALISLITTLIFSVWYFVSGRNFEWHPITPISQPSIFVRYLYSAFTFFTLGAFLYYVVRLWSVLYFIFVKILRDRKLYNLVKSLIWPGLILITYFYIVPTVVDLLNGAISFFYNLMILFLYLSPILGLFVGIFLICLYCYLKTHQKVPN